MGLLSVLLVCRKEYKSEYKKNFLPFSQYDYIDGKFFKKKGSANQETESPWYKEVIELRQKAGEYKVRLLPPFFKNPSQGPNSNRASTNRRKRLAEKVLHK